ncbi:MAG TPA: GNAT family N-acetyltransferase [Phytomonospora sp.]
MDLDIQNHARANVLGSEYAERVGPFVCRFDPDSDNIFLNYAIPDDGTDPTAAQLDELEAAFAAKGRKPRFEFLPTRSPKLADVLSARGYDLHHRGLLMSCGAGDVLDPPLPAGVSIVEATDADMFYAAATVQHPAFNDEIPAREVVVRNHERLLARGGRLAVAVTGDGLAVAAGQTGAPIDGIVEVAGIATAEAFRRRGIAAAMTAYLTRKAHESGVRTAWLDPADAGAGRAYGKAGFVTVGESYNMVLG